MIYSKNLKIESFANFILAIILIVMLTEGCQSVQYESGLMKKRKTEGARYRKSAAELRLYLDDLAGFFTGTIEQAADRVIADSMDSEIKRHALLWKINGIPTAYRALFQPDPAVAIIDTWAFSMQMVDYFERGPGKDDFGQWHYIANNASQILEKRIMEFVASGLPDGNSDPLQAQIQAWVLEHPIEREFIYRDTVTPELGSIIGDQAMDTFQTVGSLSIGVEELADQLTTYINLLTKQARWQAELVVIDIATGPDIQNGLETFGELAASANRLAPIIEKSPDWIAHERVAFFKSLQQERMEVFENFEQQRIEILSNLVRERLAIADDFKSERRTILNRLQSERENLLEGIDGQRVAMLNEFEAAGNRILENAQDKSEQLIDYIFIRVLLILAVSLLCGVVAAVLITHLKGKRNTVEAISK